ncbi:solute carrier family 52, riboflavin transporter, member 3-A [Teleopsis dalmanni]|uniref:solute carrier family 52, riboflavin transporter, member 3-A n=1 Tax=Teleopsis dalmanni TaxID=139649 RepID=UPI0018CE75DF|nr:solute carrier family 52, riboflavin transporter, member 3-A [Teleopsis dalmanni]
MKERGLISMKRSLIVDLLAIFFGIGTWIGINGTFIQLPLLVEVAPEGWSLPSYLSVMVQIGNLGPIAYTLIEKCSNYKIKDGKIIYIMLFIGTVSSLLTSFFYNETAIIFGKEHSLSLFILTIFTALTACTSSVLFMPYMGRFKEIYLITYFVGEGLSGLLPSVVALIQGIGGASVCVQVNTTEEGQPIYEKQTPAPRFGTMEFFIFVFVMMVCSCIGFTLLDRLKLAKRQYAAMHVSNGMDYSYDENDKTRRSQEDDLEQIFRTQITSKQYWLLLTLIGIVTLFSNGMLNSIQSYSCLPYGSQTYHLSATLSVIANPVACFLALFLPHTSLKSILTLSGIAACLTSYVFVTAAMSPLPPLHGTDAGAAIVIVTWTLLVGLVSYIKLSITSVMRAQGGKSLVWTGGITQFGSAIGSILIFVLINFTNSFEASYDSDC